MNRTGTLSLTSPLGQPGTGSQSVRSRASRKTANGNESVGLRAVQEQRKQEDEHQQANPTRKESSAIGCSKCSIFETMTLRTINFNELAHQKYPGKQWTEVPVGDQVELLREALKARVLVIDPHSVYMKFWDLILVICLVYTALVTPYEIAFIPPGNQFLAVLNRIVDVIFIKDMVMQFFMKVERNTRQGKIWVRDRCQVAQLYARTWFLIDLASVLPYDDLTDQMQADGIHSVKILRTIRVLRLVKLLRILKASRMVKRWENRIALKSTNLYLIKFSVLIILSCHWMACLWGFLGLLEGSLLQCRMELAADDPLLLLHPTAKYFLSDTSGLDPNDPSAWPGDSWVVRWAQSRTPGSPADPCDTGMIYVAALYWSVMTMTSVGYGDILPYTPAEYVACTSCMMISSIVWAYIIGAACAVMSKMDPELSEFERRIDDFNAMAQDQDLPQHIRWRGREYIREQRFHMHYLRNIDAWEGLGTDLRGTVARQMASHYINHIWFFKGTKAQFREDCAKNFVPHFFERREVIEMPAQLAVVERGAVGRLGRILVPWGYWGEDMLIRMSILRQDSSAMALTYTEIMSLSRDSLSHILIEFPEEQMRFRKASTLMALFAVTKIYRVEKSAGEHDEHNRWIHDVLESAQKVGKELLSENDMRNLANSWKTSPAWAERILEEEQAPPPLGEVKLSTDQKIDLMAKELYNTGEAITSVTSHRLSTKPSNFRDRFASGGGDRMERDRGDPGSKEVLQRLERIEQTLTRLSSLAGNCACQNGGAALGMKPSAFELPRSPSPEPKYQGPNARVSPLPLQDGRALNGCGALTGSIGGGDQPLRMPTGDSQGLPQCCSVTRVPAVQVAQTPPHPLRSRSRSKSPGAMRGDRGTASDPTVVSRV